MKTIGGLWIDHRKAVIVTFSEQREAIRVIESDVEKQPGRLAGVRSKAHYESRHVQADDIRERKFTGELRDYYNRVIESIRDVESILVFGPGEAKDELTKHLQKEKLGGRVAAVETVDKMTDRQIAAKTREYFRK